MPEKELREIRPGRFVKIVAGECVGIASKGEIATYFRQKYRATIDPGIIEVALALSGLFTVLTAQSLATIFKLAAGLCFLMSFLASLIFYSAYLVQRIPITWDRYFNSKFAALLRKYRIPGSLWLWMIWFYPTQLIRVALFPRNIPFDEQVTELGYLTQLASKFIGGIIVGMYVVFE